jgi:hypothetical protein
MTLERYLKEAHRCGVIDHSIRAQLNADGTVSFYIHPARVSGDTCDYLVHGNSLSAGPWREGLRDVVPQ